MPTFLVSDELRSGGFVLLLPDVKTEEVEIRVIYPNRRLLNPRVRHFIDLLTAGIRI